ncbi:MAG: hypothetical protein A2V81_05290 [Candidatus Abawacabacteria bacterium RBG_16_42_10]|uniref:NYN domain-containing protein n=1 Tax=Candidatus Abawacabacteria bacterium RBG_16_42_10 TaxID=1817814 RepID=A0A1F4XIS7_9BACT|nr:MAG: hypothetical protein A2V81_05290 [Candidatus Abawacabacteria bacterium RBG_16_42_10]
MQIMLEINNFDQAVIVSGDGDFYSLYQHLIKINKLRRLLIPNQNKFSALLRVFMSYITFLSEPYIRDKIKKRH